MHVDSLQMLDKTQPLGSVKANCKKVDEAKKQNVKTLIFNDNLSPAQTRILQILANVELLMNRAYFGYIFTTCKNT